MSDDNMTPQGPNERQVGQPDVKKGWGSFSIIWLVPLVALLVGGWLLWRDVVSKGPEITLTFETADGLVAGKTPIRYRDVDVGQVTEISLSKGFDHVRLTVRMNADFSDYLTDKTQFWVVRPRVSGRGITGLETIVSGAYIEVAPDDSGSAQDTFVGAEEPQLITSDEEGTRFILAADKLGSLSVGAPVLLRGVEVGEVLDTELDQDAKGVSVPVFIRKPFDQLVKRNTRFWDSSGIAVDLNSDGLSLRAQSVKSVLAGGINFYTPDDSEQSERAPSDTVFNLFKTLEQAELLTEGYSKKYILYFDSSVRGLSRGAPVEFNGIRVGTVESVDLEYVVDQRAFRVPVVVTLEPERVSVVGGDSGEIDHTETIATLVENGLRARLKTGSFITGQLFVDLSMHTVAPARYLGNQNGDIPELPTLPQKLDEIANSLSSLLEKVETFPIEEIGIRLLGTVEGMENIVTSPALTDGMKSLQQAADGVNKLVENLDSSVLPATQSALDAAREALGGVRDVTGPTSPVRYNLEQALKELTATARSLRDLAEFLEQNPSALILGKKGPREDE
ncbi:MAG: qaraquat-inducible protein B [Thalassospira sp.]|uniref:PqiB family protein n=1 Tax=Thalassospira sp. GB04J01 TaxID=1485225 RepID=UPI000C0D6E01|nr:MlaD family protein [Thalassospira sp. GB04J01]MBV17891.1 qaraquat-inducible protein B [Thalassospira sp.]|tara:strand:- start:147547 stop:149235 length:1689 start_codon:yes stop_codon:yes gene_type:complete